MDAAGEVWLVDVSPDFSRNNKVNRCLAHAMALGYVSLLFSISASGANVSDGVFG